MKIINVYPETHQLAKELSAQTCKSMHKVVAEALLEYQQGLQGSNRLLNKYLEQTAAVVTESVKRLIVKEVPVAVEYAARHLREQQQEDSERAAREAEQLLAEEEAARLAETKPTTVHPTKPWLGGSESDDMQDLPEAEMTELETYERPWEDDSEGVSETI